HVHDHFHAVHRVIETNALARRDAPVPFRADTLPVILGVVPILVAGPEVVARYAPIGVGAMLAGDAAGHHFAVAHHLDVVLSVIPAIGQDAVAVDDRQRVVVVTLGVFAPWQGAVALVGNPGGILAI